MNGYSRAYAANKYGGMSPERLVLAMFDGAIRFIESAAADIQGRDGTTSVAAKGEHIGKAVAIVAELQSALNPQVGELVEHLEALYDYVLRTLAQANIKSDPKLLNEAKELLLVLREGWAQMLDSVQAEKAAPPTKAVAAGGGAKGYL